MESLFIITAVAGAVEFLKRLQLRDIWAALTIAVSAGIGALAAVTGMVDGISVADGIVAGLSASGLITVVSKFGKNTVSPEARV